VVRVARLSLLCLIALAAVVVTGCGNKDEDRHFSLTEGPYIKVDDLTYQIQISRILEPSDLEDQAYLRGRAPSDQVNADEVWFAVFLRVQNQTDRVLTPSNSFKIVDTQGNTYRPLQLDAKVNDFLYVPAPIEAGIVVPRLDSPSYNGPIQGSLLLFKLTVQTLYNRPLAFHIESSEGGEPGIINLDV
jgi:hypothetical protein